MKHKESPLIGGRTAEDVVKVENTVRRPTNSNSDFIHLLLKHLEKKEFIHCPRFLGIDEKEREILSFIEGIVPHGEITWTNSQMVKAIKILRKFHDATADSELKGESEVVCHNDFAPWNIVIHKNIPVGIIDFDNAAPGARIDDIGYFLWTFLDLGSDIDKETQMKRIVMLTDSYGSFDKKGLVEAILNQQDRILKLRNHLADNDKNEEKRKFSKDAAERIKTEIQWIKDNRKEIDTRLNK